MLNPVTMNFLSDDMQNQFLKESIKATMKIEQAKSFVSTSTDAGE